MAEALKIRLPNQLADVASALADAESGIEVQEGPGGSVALGLTASMEQTLNVRPTKGGIAPYKARPFQRVLHTLIEMLWVANIPIRFIILKSRQLGVTTDIQGIIHDFTRRMQGISARTIAHRRPEARKIHEMQKRYYFHCPPEFKREVETGKVHRDRLKYKLPHDSDIAVYTSGGSNIGRSETTIIDHWTEFAFWQDAADTYNDLNQSIHDIGGTAIFIESTANGKNFFYQLWQQAHDPNQLWIPIFISWLEDPEAWIDFSSDYERDKFVESYTDEERRYAEKWELEPERMRWVRAKIKNKCAGSWNKFNQEYPIDPSVAFLFTGWPVFNLQTIGDMLKPENLQAPLFRGDIRWAGNSIRTKLDEGDYGPLTLWEKEADPNATYSLGVDVAEGLNADFSEIIVIKHDPLSVVAQYRANDQLRGKPGLLGLRAMQLGAKYNWGLLGVESNSAGHTTLEVCQRGMVGYPQLTQYPNLYFHIQKDRRTLAETEQAGWRTGPRNKRNMISNLSESVLNEEWDINSVPLLLQMNNLTWDPKRNSFGMGYVDPLSNLANDDGCIALAIANEMRRVVENDLLAESLHMQMENY